MQIILASKSPRRKDLLDELGISFKIHPSSYAEDVEYETPQRTALMHAVMKARDIAQHYQDAIVIGVDTIGVYQNKLIGKPKNRQEAKEMLEFLNNSTHKVVSGLCVIDTDQNKEYSDTVTTEITFTKMSKEEIELYLASGEGDDKAASYAIQGLGSLFVKEIKGDYFNVVGLPMHTLQHLFKKLGKNLLDFRINTK